MKKAIDTKITYLIVLCMTIVLLFGIVVVNGLPNSFGVDNNGSGTGGGPAEGTGENSGDGSSGTINATLTQTAKVESSKDYCKSFYISPKKPAYNSGIKNNRRIQTGLGAFTISEYLVSINKSGENCANDNSKYIAYCLDPSNSGPTSSDSTYRWERDLNPENNGTVGRYDRGIVYIYQNAYPNHNYNNNQYLTSDNYMITNIAARWLTFHVGFNYGGLGHESVGDYKYNGEAYRYTSMFIDGLCNDSNSKCKYYRFRPSTSAGTNIYNAAVALYNEAKNATIDDIWKGQNELTFSSTVEVEKTQIDESYTFVKNITGTLSGIDAFDGKDKEKSYVKNLRVTCDNDKIKCEILDEAGNPISAEKVLNDGSTSELKYQVRLSGKLSDLAAKTVKVEVEVDYFDSRDYTNAMIAYSTTHGANFQRMILFAESTVRGKKQTFEVSMCDIDITQFQDVEEVEEYFYNYCDVACFKSPKLTPGDPSFDKDEFLNAGCCGQLAVDDPIYEQYCTFDCIKTYLPNVCDDSGEPVEAYVKEGIEKATGEVNYNLCVTDMRNNIPANAPKKDAAGNSYMMGDQGDINVTKNKYCSVSCIEDWEFTLPGSQHDIQAGTYFMLSAKMKGTRTCVTTNIKYGSQSDQYKAGYFLYDLDKINEEIVKAYNVWNKLVEIKKAIDAEPKDTGTESCSYSGRTCGADAKGCTPCSSGSKGPRSYTVIESMSDKDIIYYVYNKNKSNPGYGNITTQSGKLKDSEFGNSLEDSYGSHSSSNGTCTCTIDITNWNADDNYTKLSTLISDAKSDYDELIEERNSIIDQIRDCSAWENDYEFDPIISYAYEEDYYMSTFIKDNNYFIAQVGEDEMKAEADASLYCQESYADDYYECQGGSSSSSQTETKLISTCSLGSGCKTENITVPKNQNIKLQESRASLYKPYTVFYTKHPTGEVTGEAVDIEDDYIEAGKITRLGRVMPVRITTPKGVYNFKFAFNQIGQFNDIDDRAGTDEKENLGRLMNYTNNNSSVVSEDAAEENPLNVEPIVTVNSKFINDKRSVFDAIGLLPLYVCTYEIYEDVCKCCGEDDFEIEGDVGNVGGNKPPTGMGINDEGYLTYYYRSVSLNDLFPNSSGGGSLTGSRPAGSNWTNDKGQQAYNAITAAGEFAYEEPEYSYLLTPSSTAKIRAYNSAQEALGGFADFGLSCNEYGYDCTSTFLDNFDSIVDEKATLVRDNTFVHYKEEELKFDEGKLPTGVGPSMK